MENAGLKVRILAMALIVPLALTACGDATGVEEDHGEEVEGVQIWLSGAMIASYDGDTGSWTGELEVDVGTETAHMDVRFVDHELRMNFCKNRTADKLLQRRYDTLERSTSFISRETTQQLPIGDNHIR